MKFTSHKDQVLVIDAAGTMSFPSEDDLVLYVLEKIPLELLLRGVQLRTPAFVGHEQAVDKLKEIVNGVTAASVAAVLTAPPPILPPTYADYLDALRYSILAYPQKNADFGVLKAIMPRLIPQPP